MTTKLSGLLKQVNAAAKEIATAIQGVDGQIAELQAERQRIGDAPVSKADFLAAVARTLDAKEGGFGANKARHFATLDFSFFAVERGFHGVNFLLEDATTRAEITERGLYWYLKPAIWARMEEIADGLALPADAMPPEQRRNRIAAIDDEIAKLRAQRNEMAEQLHAAGLIS